MPRQYLELDEELVDFRQYKPGKLWFSYNGKHVKNKATLVLIECPICGKTGQEKDFAVDHILESEGSYFNAVEYCNLYPELEPGKLNSDLSYLKMYDELKSGGRAVKKETLDELLNYPTESPAIWGRVKNLRKK